jgi:hypothetical protein
MRGVKGSISASKEESRRAKECQQLSFERSRLSAPTFEKKEEGKGGRMAEYRSLFLLTRRGGTVKRASPVIVVLVPQLVRITGTRGLFKETSSFLGFRWCAGKRKEGGTGSERSGE